MIANQINLLFEKKGGGSLFRKDRETEQLESLESRLCAPCRHLWAGRLFGRATDGVAPGGAAVPYALP